MYVKPPSRTQVHLHCCLRCDNPTANFMSDNLHSTPNPTPSYTISHTLTLPTAASWMRIFSRFQLKHGERIDRQTDGWTKSLSELRVRNSKLFWSIILAKYCIISSCRSHKFLYGLDFIQSVRRVRSVLTWKEIIVTKQSILTIWQSRRDFIVKS